jgi:hypothetical protein
MSKRDEEFRKWLNGPEALRISKTNYGAGTGPMIEDFMRSAFEAGFQACLAEVHERLSELARESKTSERPAVLEAPPPAG